MKFTMTTILCAVMLFTACNQASEPTTTIEPTASNTPEPMLQEEIPEMNDMQRLINFYASTVCMMSDPNFWEGMFDDDLNGWIDTSTPEGEAKAAKQEQQMLAKLGYSSMEEVEADMATYQGRTALIAGIATKIEEQCSGAISEEDLGLILDQLKE